MLCTNLQQKVKKKRVDMKAPGEKLIYFWLFTSPSSRAYLICLPLRVTHLPSNLCSYCALVMHQLCPTLRHLMHCNLQGSSVHGVPQARVLEWVAISSSRRSSPPRDQTLLSCCLLDWQADSLSLSHLGSPCLATHESH